MLEGLGAKQHYRVIYYNFIIFSYGTIANFVFFYRGSIPLVVCPKMFHKIILLISKASSKSIRSKWVSKLKLCFLDQLAY
jgi:hypothetical protein